MKEHVEKLKMKINSIDEATQRSTKAASIRDRLHTWSEFEARAGDMEAIKAGDLPPHAVTEVPIEQFQRYDCVEFPEELTDPEGVWAVLDKGYISSVHVKSPENHDANERIETASNNGMVKTHITGAPTPFPARGPVEVGRVCIGGQTLQIPYLDLIPGRMEAPYQTMLSILDERSVDAPLISCRPDEEDTPILVDGHTRLKMIEMLRNEGAPIEFEIEEIPPRSKKELLDKALILNTHDRNIDRRKRHKIIQQLKEIHQWPDDYSKHGIGTYLAEVLCVSDSTVSRDLKALRTKSHPSATTIRKLNTEKSRINTVSTALGYLAKREVDALRHLDMEWTEEEKELLQRYFDALGDALETRRKEIEDRLADLEQRGNSNSCPESRPEPEEGTDGTEDGA